MFKLLRLFLPILIIVFVLPMVLPGSNGKPVMSPKDWLPDQSTLSKLSHFFSTVVNEAATLVGRDGAVEQSNSVFSRDQQLNGNSSKFYKWQDKNGQWHFSDDPKQAQGYQTSQQTMPEVMNRMPALVKEDAGSSEPAVSSDQQGFQFSPTSIPINDIPKLIEDTKKVRAQLEQHNRELEQM